MAGCDESLHLGTMVDAGRQTHVRKGYDSPLDFEGVVILEEGINGWWVVSPFWAALVCFSSCGAASENPPL